MKPKTDRQREIVALSAALPEITENQKRWAYDHCFERTAFYSKGSAWCSHCGKSFKLDGTSELIVEAVGDKTTCPHCGTHLTLKNSRRRKISERWYYTIITTRKGYQVCRHFIAEKFLRMGEQPFFEIHEAVQNWIATDGKEEVIARPCRPIMMIYDAWNFCKPMELRDTRQRVNYNTYRPDKYKVGSSWTYPNKTLLPQVKRNGYTGRCTTLPQSELIKLLLSDREAEMLAKNGQFALLGYKYAKGYREFCMPFAHSIRIANRNRYIVNDASLWFDYLDLLAYFRLDTHNAHYVCPRNLKAEHDRLLKRKRRIEAEKTAREKIREAAKWEEQYRADKAKYFGICFGNDDIVITVIQSVAEMAEEGRAMHHCVYDAGYYKKPDSLILTARDHDGNRIETIEISLTTFSVIQSRAKFNKSSKYHDEIINLINQNINLIKQAA